MRRTGICWLLVALLGALLVAEPAQAQAVSGSSASAGIVRENPVDQQAGKELPAPDRLSSSKELAQEASPLLPPAINVAIGDIPVGKSISIFFDVTVNVPFPNSVTEVSNQGTVSGGNLDPTLTDDPDDPTGSTDPTLTSILAAPVLAGATKTVSDVPLGNGDGMAQAGEILTYTISVANSGNGGDVNVNINDVLPAELSLDLGSVAVVLGGGASGAVDSSAGNTLNVTVASVPGAGGSVTVTFNATLASPVPAGFETLSNIAQVSSTKVPLFDTTQADIAVDAIPVFTLDKDDGGVSVDPGATVIYTLTYENTGSQDASNVVVDDTVPVGTTFDAAASSGGWSCFDGDPAGTMCTIVIGTVPGGSSASVDFAAEVVPPQNAPPQINNSATVRDDGAGSSGVPVEATDSDSTPVNDLLPPTVANVDTILGNGDSTLEECESVANRVGAFEVDFSEAMDAATVTDAANWQVVGSGPDLDLSTTVCGGAAGDDLLIAIDGVTYDAIEQSALVALGGIPWLDNGPYRLMACSGAGGVSDAAGNELDGDGDFVGGDDFVRTFRIDLIDAFDNGHFDCALDPWLPVTGGGSTIAHDALVDMDNAGISGSAHLTNEPGNVDLSLGQCVDVGAGAVHDFTGFVLLDTPATSVEVIRACEFYASTDCSGATFPVQFFFDNVSTDGVWVGFDGLVSVPPSAQSTLCQVTVRTLAGAPYEAFLDDLSFDLIQSPIIFEDGFESGDTSAWSQTVP